MDGGDIREWISKFRRANRANKALLVGGLLTPLVGFLTSRIPILGEWLEANPWIFGP